MSLSYFHDGRTSASLPWESHRRPRLNYYGLYPGLSMVVGQLAAVNHTPVKTHPYQALSITVSVTNWPLLIIKLFLVSITESTTTQVDNLVLPIVTFMLLNWTELILNWTELRNHSVSLPGSDQRLRNQLVIDDVVMAIQLQWDEHSRACYQAN